MYNLTQRHVRVTIVAAEKQEVLHILCVCFCVCVALGIQHAMRMRHIVVYSALQYFSTYLINVTIFAKKNLLNRKCVLIFSTNFF
jgi:hypothetical protein